MDKDMRSFDFDIAVVGGTPAGCAAAIMAARLGCTVCILEPTATLGGMNACGQDAFDTGSLQAISGIAEEFGSRVRAFYAAQNLSDPLFDSDTDLSWENHVASLIWRQMISEYPQITLHLGAVTIGVDMDRKRIAKVRWERAHDAMGNPGEVDSEVPSSIAARVVIDASYEGDVAAWSGAEYRLGREGRSADEPHAGEIFTTYMDREIGDRFPPHTILPGSSGAASERIMAFNSRLCCKFYPDLSKHAPHRLQAPPAGYDPKNYAFDRQRYFPNGRPGFGTNVVPGVGGKFHLNRMFDGNDLVGPNREYVLAHPRDRGPLRQRFIDHALGFLYFIQNEGGCPDIGLADDEFKDNGNIPYQIYVREGRRIVGLTTISEANINPFIRGDGPRPPVQPDAIAIGDYFLDGKICEDRRAVGKKYQEGAFFLRWLRAPFQVPYGCMVSDRVENLLVPCALSVTHVAWTAARMEAVWLQTGMAAGIAAALASLRHVAVSEIPIVELQEIMIDYRAKLTYFADLSSEHPHFGDIQWAALRTFLPQDRKWRFWPDQAATWSDIVRATVICLKLPISVTGAHFEGVDPGHPDFRYVETLYDLGSRADIETFPHMRNPRIDALADANRQELRTRWMEIDLSRAVSGREMSDFLHAIAGALGAPLDRAALFCRGNGLDVQPSVTRGLLCGLLRYLDKHVSNSERASVRTRASLDVASA